VGQTIRAGEIARSGRVLPGSISERRTRCGRANCACHGDLPRLHAIVSARLLNLIMNRLFGLLAVALRSKSLPRERR
jgi:hypothetical protein